MLGALGLLVGAVLLRGAAQVANRTLPDQPGGLITPAERREWWPWTLLGIAVVLVAWRSSVRPVRRHVRSAVGRGEAEYL